MDIVDNLIADLKSREDRYLNEGDAVYSSDDMANGVASYLTIASLRSERDALREALGKVMFRDDDGAIRNSYLSGMDLRKYAPELDALLSPARKEE